MWLNSHRIEQTRDFNALITDPWVASGLRAGQNPDGSSKAGRLIGTAVVLLEFLCGGSPRGETKVCHDRQQAKVDWNGAAINALFMGAGAGSAATALRQKV